VLLLLLRPGRSEQPPAQNGPSGGLSWLRGYTPRFAYVVTPTPREQDRRDEVALLLAQIV
jgi:hypothetical protein